MVNGLVKFLAGLGIVALSQVLWMASMMYAAAQNPDPTCGGAYSALWMLGIPVVFIVSILFSLALLVEKGE